MTTLKTWRQFNEEMNEALLKLALTESQKNKELAEEEANSIRKLKVPSGAKRKQLKQYKQKLDAQASQSAKRARKVRDLVNRPKSWSGLEEYPSS